jgi:hypothetical protein
MEVLNRQKKKNTSSKARLISFYNRHHSNSPILIRKKKSDIEKKFNLTNDGKKKILNELEKKDFIKESEEDDENKGKLKNDQTCGLVEFIKNSSDREKGLELTEAEVRRRENEVERREIQLDIREFELETRENQLKSAEDSIFYRQQELDFLIDKVKLKEIELKRDEEVFNTKRVNVSQEVTSDIEKKVKEFEMQKHGLDILLKKVMDQIAELDKRKSEIFHFQEKRKSFDGLDRIDEESEEGSLDLSDNTSFESYKQKNFILSCCQELSKENQDISSKIDEIMASLSYSSSLF